MSYISGGTIIPLKTGPKDAKRDRPPADGNTESNRIAIYSSRYETLDHSNGQYISGMSTFKFNKRKDERNKNSVPTER